LESVFKIKYLGKVVKRGINKQILINFEKKYLYKL